MTAAERQMTADAIALSKEHADRADELQALLKRAVQEWFQCECPYGSCPVYPHPVMREAAAASGWEPPEGNQPWQDGHA